MQDAPEMTREQAALLARCLQPGAGGELQRRIARGDEDEELPKMIAVFDTYFRMSRAKLGHDHVPIGTWDIYQALKQRSLLVHSRATTPVAMTYGDGRGQNWPENWRPNTAREIAEALIAELRNALIPTRYQMTRDPRSTEHLKTVDRLLKMAEVCADRLCKATKEGPQRRRYPVPQWKREPSPRPLTPSTELPRRAGSHASDLSETSKTNKTPRRQHAHGRHITGSAASCQFSSARPPSMARSRSTSAGRNPTPRYAEQRGSTCEPRKRS